MVKLGPTQMPYAGAFRYNGHNANNVSTCHFQQNLSYNYKIDWKLVHTCCQFGMFSINISIIF